MAKRISWVEINPELAKQWHPWKNEGLKPTDVTTDSREEVWWYFPYNDPKTGKHFDFEWRATIKNRRKNNGCPFLSGHRCWSGFNDLATKNPELAKQWHPTKNGTLKPTDVLVNYSEPVWWLFPYDDPETGKHFDFEWPATPNSRNRSSGCPYLSGHRCWPGFNDLATKNPKLAKQWHPTKNGVLKPADRTANSHEEVWWYLPYDDPKTGKHFDFEWQAKISKRNGRGDGCPFLSGQACWPGFNDLATKNPKLAKEWHPTKNGTLKPSDILANSDEEVWWFLPYDDPETGKHFDFEWPARVYKRNGRGDGCPFLSGQACWPGFNDLATKNPKLAKEWHPTKNGTLKPTDRTANSEEEVWWHLPYDDPKTGKHFDFEWPASISDRNTGNGCPFLSGRACWPGFNDLATKNPKLAKEWHPTKNGTLKPTDVTANSHEEVWWYLPYDDPETGKHFDFEWKAIISNRNKGIGCTFLSGQACWTGFNDLATKNPKLAKEWHPTKNGTLKPTDRTANSNEEVWWYLPYDDPKTGRHFDFEWPAKIKNRNKGTRCPYIVQSRGEQIINSYLLNQNITFTIEKTVKNIGRFDFFTEYGFIEFDGIQHFTAVKYFGGEKHFKQTIFRDTRKSNYCRTHNIPLLRIRYDQIDQIEEILKHFFANPDFYLTRFNPHLSDEEYYLEREENLKLDKKAA